MLKGDDRTLGEYRFELVDVERITGPNYKADMGTIRIYKNEKELMTLHPEKRIYNVRKNIMTEASIHSNLLRDLYVSLGEQRDINTGAWSVRLYYKPFILWIWLGGFVMVLGGSLALTDKRYRTSLKQEEIKLDDNNVIAN
jgi:cytochrome c-type biogenesis protein CcmF